MKFDTTERSSKSERKQIEVNLEINFNNPDKLECDFIEVAHNMTLSNDEFTQAMGRLYKTFIPAFCDSIRQVNKGLLKRSHIVQELSLVIAHFISLGINSAVAPEDQEYAAATIGKDFAETVSLNIRNGFQKRPDTLH